VWEGIPAWIKPSVRRPPPETGSVKRLAFSKRRAADAFLRDRFVCRYCGQRLVPVCLLSVVGHLFPAQVPYVSTYKQGFIHSLYWLIGAEADHIVPCTRGGDWTDPENHATACVLCNSRKSDWTLDELGWTIQPRLMTRWNGALPTYRDAWEAAGRPSPTYHTAWLRAFGVAGLT
jgi:5-methylcytosine-specific restriction endonuclease McrA